MVIMKKIMLFTSITSVCFVLFYSCVGGNKLTIGNRNNVTNGSLIKNVTLYDVPDGYNHNDIRYIKTHKLTMIITYKDSSILYVGDDVDMIPNQENIIQLRTTESVWRLHFILLSALKEVLSPSERSHKQYEDYSFSYSELLDYEMPSLLDLGGSNNGMVWRDILFDGVCIGYIVRDSSRVQLFDQCLESTVSKAKWARSRQSN